MKTLRNYIKWIFVLMLLYGIFINGKIEKTFITFPASILTENNVYGIWEVVECKEDYQSPGSNKNAWKYIHKDVSLTPKLAVLFQDSCKSPIYTVTRQSTWRFLDDEFRINSLPGVKDDTVIVIELRCKTEPIYASKDSPTFGSDFMLTSNRELIWFNDGLWLYMKKVR